MNVADNNYTHDNLIEDLLGDLTGQEGPVDKDTLQTTITNIMKDYNLSTNEDFIEKVAKLKFSDNGKTETVALDALPTELKDAAWLPVNTIADIALRQDLDLVISQIPEWFTALTVSRDAVCESDVVTGKLSRTISFDHSVVSDDSTETQNIMSTIEEVEERLDLHSIIKNHCVFNTLEYGEGYAYVIPYAKVFEDLYKYRLNNGTNTKPNQSVSTMFDTSSALSGMGYSESTVEVSLRDKIIEEVVEEKRKEQERIANDKKRNRTYTRNNCGDLYTESVSISETLFTESEVMNVYPLNDMGPINDDGRVQKYADEKSKKEHLNEFDELMNDITNNIRYIGNDIALPVIEESAHDLRAVYMTKYNDVYSDEYMQEADNFFKEVMDDSKDPIISKQFSNIKGVYIRILPATKLIPIRIDRIVVGYYYISDLTRPEQSGMRRNSGLSGYTLKSPLNFMKIIYKLY